MKKEKSTVFAKRFWYMLVNAFNTQLGSLQLSLCLHFLLEHSLKISQQWEFSVFSEGPKYSFWICTSPWFCTWSNYFQGICGNFSKPIFPKHLTPQSFFPKLFDVSMVCPNCYSLPCLAPANKFALKCFVLAGCLFALEEFCVW